MDPFRLARNLRNFTWIQNPGQRELDILSALKDGGLREAGFLVIIETKAGRAALLPKAYSRGRGAGNAKKGAPL